MAEPEAPQRDRWEEAAIEFRLRDCHECQHGRAAQVQIDPYQCPQCIADFGRAAYQQGQKDADEIAALLRIYLETPNVVHAAQMRPKMREWLRSRAQEEPKR